ncbi:hypothetical protein BLA29_001709 [Euroglyphus maynei]|uniref:Uncharacterized protein n=1 Tax=Euroglyphus maynei TaxID=6958 RepID=A0A1Y3B896_EURMA|nr:hypothetical protein BLA29_001709 [Euroglyphus maynei]
MPQVEVKIPELKGPKVSSQDVDANIDLSLSPDKIKDPKLKNGKDWQFHLPRFSFKGKRGKISGPDLSEAKQLEGEIDVDGLRLKRAKSEEKDIRTSSPSKDKESHGYHFTLPRFRLKNKSPKVKLTGPSLSVESPDIRSAEVSIKKLKQSDRSTTLPADEIEDSLEGKTGALLFGLRNPLRRGKSKSPETKKKLDNIKIDIESKIDKSDEIIDLDIRNVKTPTTDGKGLNIQSSEIDLKSSTGKINVPEKKDEIHLNAGDVEIKTDNVDRKEKRSKSKEKEKNNKKKKGDDQQENDDQQMKPKDLDTAFIEAIESLEAGSQDRSSGLKFPKLSFKRRDKRNVGDDDHSAKSPTKEQSNIVEQQEKDSGKKTRKSKSPDSKEKVPISSAIYGKFSGKHKIPEGSMGITMPGFGRTDNDKQEFLKAYPPGKPEDIDEKIVIRFVLLKSGNEQPLEEVRLDSTKSEKQIKDAIRTAIKSATSKPISSDTQTKIFARVIRVKPEGERFLKEYEIDPKNSAVLDDVQQALISSKHSAVYDVDDDDHIDKIILSSFAMKSKNGKEERIDQIELLPKNTDKEIENIIQKLIEKSLPKAHEPDSVAIIRMIAVRPYGDEKIIEEFLLESKKSPKENLERISPKILKPLRATHSMRKPNKIIRIILRKPNGDEQVDDLIVEPKTTAKDIDDLIKDSIRRKLPQIKESDAKIITKIIHLKPGKEESTEEFEIDVETARKNLDDSINIAPRTQSLKKKDSFGRIITKIFKSKPDGQQEMIEETVEDPKMTGKDIGEDHTFGMFFFLFFVVVEKIQQFFHFYGKNFQQVSQVLEFGWQSFSRDDVKKPKKIIRVILKTPNGHETMDDHMIDPETDAKDVEKLLMEKIQAKLSDIPESQTKIIAKIIDLKPGETETTQEFETDPEAAKKDLEKVLKQAPRTKTTRRKDHLGRIITKIFKRNPDGKETVEEHIEDPTESGRDIGDDTLGKFIICS